MQETVYPFKNKHVMSASLKSNTLHSWHSYHRLHSTEHSRSSILNTHKYLKIRYLLCSSILNEK